MVVIIENGEQLEVSDAQACNLEKAGLIYHCPSCEEETVIDRNSWRQPIYHLSQGGSWEAVDNAVKGGA